jgi:hypothetical protein
MVRCAHPTNACFDLPRGKSWPFYQAALKTLRKPHLFWLTILQLQRAIMA